MVVVVVEEEEFEGGGKGMEKSFIWLLRMMPVEATMSPLPKIWLMVVVREMERVVESAVTRWEVPQGVEGVEYFGWEVVWFGWEVVWFGWEVVWFELLLLKGL